MSVLQVFEAARFSRSRTSPSAFLASWPTARKARSMVAVDGRGRWSPPRCAPGDVYHSAHAIRLAPRSDREHSGTRSRSRIPIAGLGGCRRGSLPGSGRTTVAFAINPMSGSRTACRSQEDRTDESRRHLALRTRHLADPRRAEAGALSGRGHGPGARDHGEPDGLGRDPTRPRGRSAGGGRSSAARMTPACGRPGREAAGVRAVMACVKEVYAFARSERRTVIASRRVFRSRDFGPDIPCHATASRGPRGSRGPAPRGGPRGRSGPSPRRPHRDN